jgi:glycosyltransferase involved in cell wall biosynthesis
MKVLVVSGIWPPDVGGPASHAPDLARFLAARGHDVEVVVTADSEPREEPFNVYWASRALPTGLVHAVSAGEIARSAHRAEVVYTTGMFARTAIACGFVRRPFVIKLTGDPAFERSRARGHVAGDIEAFQRGGGGIEATLLRQLRDHTVRRAAHVVCPSEYLRGLAIGWGASSERTSVLPNATPVEQVPMNRLELRQSLGIDGNTVAFAGRFGPQKSLDVLVTAVGQVDGVTLLLAGEGGPVQFGQNVRLLGPLDRARVLELFAAADVVALSSTWENFPHALVEALAVGTPVIATDVGGVSEIVRDGVNGLLVPAGDADALAAAIRRFFGDPQLRERLAAAAAPSVERYRPESVYTELERILEEAAR